LCEFVGGGYGNVDRGVPWHDEGGWEPCEGFGYSFYVGGPGPGTVTPIVAEGWSEIPAFNGAGSPGFTHVWFLVYDNFGARWYEGIAIKIKSAMRVGLGR
jgi:hypothetical protein